MGVGRHHMSASRGCEGDQCSMQSAAIGTVVDVVDWVTALPEPVCVAHHRRSVQPEFLFVERANVPRPPEEQVVLHHRDRCACLQARMRCKELMRKNEQTTVFHEAPSGLQG